MGAPGIVGHELAPLVMFFSPRDRWLNAPTMWLLGIVLGLLLVAFFVGRALIRQPESVVNPALVRTFNLRVKTWLMMCAILVFGFLLGYGVTVAMFGLVSFWALREFITATPTRRGDHRTLFWVFFLFTPLQYVLIGITPAVAARPGGTDLYGLYSIMIPVYASLFIPARIAFSGDHKRFLERSAKIQAGLLICVYSLSYAPALLALDLTTYEGGVPAPWRGSKAGLLFYFILVVQLADVAQYAWTRLLGKWTIAPDINASRTWEGFLGGVLSATLVGMLLWWATPFNYWQSALMSMTIAVMGFAGGMTMSAIKRDRGITDYGTLVQGHAGVLDRIDSICFAAPVFFHLTRYFFSA